MRDSFPNGVALQRTRMIRWIGRSEGDANHSPQALNRQTSEVGRERCWLPIRNRLLRASPWHDADTTSAFAQSVLFIRWRSLIESAAFQQWGDVRFAAGEVAEKV